MGVIETVARKASRQAPAPVYPRLVERMIRALGNTSDFWEAIDRAQMPVVFAAAIVRALLDEGLLQVRQGRLKWTAGGQQAVETLGLHPLPRYHCLNCEGRGVVPPYQKKWADVFMKYESDRPAPRQEYDQGSVTPATTLSRVAFMDQWGDIDGKNILVMGAEDDLMGLAIGLTQRACKVVIIDIDARIIEFEKEIIAREGLKNVFPQVFDLRRPFPSDWEGAFDVFLTDPPETLLAFKAFIARGVSALNDAGAAGYFGLTLRDSSLYRWRKFQQAIVAELGMVITDIIQDFNHYMNWGYHEDTRASALNPAGSVPRQIWYKSAWYRIEALPRFRGINEPIEAEVFESLYSDEEGVTT